MKETEPKTLMFKELKSDFLRTFKKLVRTMFRSSSLVGRDSKMKEFNEPVNSGRWDPLQKKYGELIRKHSEDALSKTQEISEHSFRDNPRTILEALRSYEKLVLDGLRLAKADKRRNSKGEQCYSKSDKLADVAKYLFNEAINFHLSLLSYTIHLDDSQSFGDSQFNAYRDIAVHDIDKRLSRTIPRLVGQPDWKPHQRLIRWRDRQARLKEMGT